MALFLVSYDILDQNAKNYELLWKGLENIGATKILYSEWVVKGETGVEATISNKLAPLTHPQDRLLVQEILRGAKWDQTAYQ